MKDISDLMHALTIDMLKLQTTAMGRIAHKYARARAYMRAAGLLMQLKELDDIFFDCTCGATILEEEQDG